MGKTDRCLFSLGIGIILLFSEHSLNHIASSSNGGMPVAIQNNMIIITPNHIVMNSSSHFKLLCDIIRVSNHIYSIGDLLGFIGLLLFYISSVYLVFYIIKWFLKQRKGTTDVSDSSHS